MQAKNVFILVLLLLLFSALSFGSLLTGKVIRVLDGDIIDTRG